MVIVLDALDFFLTGLKNLIVVDCMNVYTKLLQPVYSMLTAESLSGSWAFASIINVLKSLDRYRLGYMPSPLASTYTDRTK